MERKKYEALREDKEIAVKFLAAIFKEKKKRKKVEVSSNESKISW